MRLALDEKDFFEKMASRYQSYAILVPGASRFRNILLDKAMKRALTPILGSFRRFTILDVGCGIGRWAKVMARHNSVIGVDASISMIKMARDSCKGRSCAFVVADVSSLPFRENVVDLVVSVTVLQHLLDAQKFSMAMAEISRCCVTEALIAEEMWSDKETVLKVNCPTRILPVESYVVGFLASGFHTYCLGGITFAPLTIHFTRWFSSVPRGLEGTLNVKLRTSKIISWLVHFVLGAGVLSALLPPKGYHNPRLSLHTIMRAKKNKPNGHVS